jgi:hypothetical protein
VVVRMWRALGQLNKPAVMEPQANSGRPILSRRWYHAARAYYDVSVCVWG